MNKQPKPEGTTHTHKKQQLFNMLIGLTRLAETTIGSNSMVFSEKKTTKYVYSIIYEHDVKKKKRKKKVRDFTNVMKISH